MRIHERAPTEREAPAQRLLNARLVRSVVIDARLDEGWLLVGDRRCVGVKTPAGIAVHTGARVASHAKPGEVLVSSTVKDLVAGSGLTFAGRGTHNLKGIPGEWKLFSVSSTDAAP